MTWIYRLLAVLAWLVTPVFLAWVAFETHTSTSSTCWAARCTSTTVTTSDWLTHPAEVVGLLLLFLVIGVVPAGIILWRGISRSTRSLVVLWLLVPLMALLTIGAAFTVVGSAAFFWGGFFLLAALLGSAEAVWHAGSRFAHQFAAPSH
jgi:hypothetical protein